MRSRPFVPGGRAGLLVLAFAAVPIILSKSKPLAKRLGEKMVQWGEKLKREAATPDAAETSSNADVKKSTAEENIQTASPTGKEEVKAQTAASTAGKKAPPKAQTPTKKKAAPKAKPGTTTNPKDSK